MRLPGGRAQGGLPFVIPRTLLFRTDHRRRVFVPRVDFVTAPGSPPPSVHRRGGVSEVVSDLAVLAFHPGRKRLELASVHPGVTLRRPTGARAETSRVGKRGAIVVPARMRRKFGIEEGSLVIAEERDEGILIRPAVAVPVERHTPAHIAEFLAPPQGQRIETLGQALGSCPAVVFAYLFGSAAAGPLRPLSDVDVAVYLDETADATATRLEVLGALSRHLGTDEIDLVVLNRAPTALAGRILGARRVILDRDPHRRQRFESLALRKFLDFRMVEHRLLSRRFARG